MRGGADRLIGMGVIPITNVDDAIAEMKHCKKLGFKGILLGALPSGKATDAGGRQVLGRRGRPRHARDRARPALPHRARATQPTIKYPKEDPVSCRASAGRSSNGCSISALRHRSASPSWSCPACSAPPKYKMFFAETRPAGTRSGSNTWISGTSATSAGPRNISASSR